MMTGCDHGKFAPTESMLSLHESQAGVGRHKCVVCGYHAGMIHGREQVTGGTMEICSHGSRAPANVLADLPSSQAGEGRHKCAVCSYARGFIDGAKS